MTEYAKSTVKDFQTRLEAGGYAGITGVRRAVGRMSTWSDAQKAKALTLGEAHFEGSAPAKKAIKKVAKKRGRPPKAKAEPEKKVAKKRGRPPKVKTAPVEAVAVVQDAPKKVPGKRGRKPGTTSVKVQSAAMHMVDESDRKNDLIHKMLINMEINKRLGAPESDVAAGAKMAQKVVGQLVAEIYALTDAILEPGADATPTKEERQAAEAFERAALAANPGGNGVLLTPGVTAVQPYMASEPDPAQTP